jgi:hypothetical protein
MPRFPRKSLSPASFTGRMLSRRRMLSFLVGLAALAVPAVRHRIVETDEDAFVMVNGWVLKKDDVTRP